MNIIDPIGVLAVSIPPDFQAEYYDRNTDMVDIIQFISADKRYLPRATLLYSPNSDPTPTKDTFRDQIANTFSGATVLTTEKYRDTENNRLIHSFNATIHHPKHEALWGGDSVFLSTLMRLSHQEQIWSIRLTAQLPTSNAPELIEGLHHMLRTATLSDKALEIYLSKLPTRQ